MFELEELLVLLVLELEIEWEEMLLEVVSRDEDILLELVALLLLELELKTGEELLIDVDDSDEELVGAEEHCDTVLVDVLVEITVLVTYEVE